MVECFNEGCVQNYNTRCALFDDGDEADACCILFDPGYHDDEVEEEE
jgi:hypothetical protein